MPLRSVMEISGAYAQSFFSFWNSFLRFFSLSLEIFFRNNFGERYFNLGALIAVCVALFLYTNVFCFFQVIVLSTFFGKDVLLIHRFTYAVIGVGILNLWSMHKRKKRGERIHSWYSGDSLLNFLPVSQHVLQLYIEPGLCFLIGFLFVPDLILSQWIGIASVSMFLVRRSEWSRLDNFIHDALDREIEAKYLQEAILERKSPKETEGLFVASSLHYPNLPKETLEDAMELLDPGLKNLLQKRGDKHNKNTDNQEVN
jgi:hypothetical protein